MHSSVNCLLFPRDYSKIMTPIAGFKHIIPQLAALFLQDLTTFGHSTVDGDEGIPDSHRTNEFGWFFCSPDDLWELSGWSPSVQSRLIRYLRAKGYIYTATEKKRRAIWIDLVTVELDVDAALHGSNDEEEVES
jgi:hypothetical protein